MIRPASFAEPTLPTIVSSDAVLSWYNRESRTLPVGGTVEVLSGTEVTLTCKYSAFPEADVEWTVLNEEGDPLPDAGYKIVNGSLVLMALQPSDSAQYACSVTNLAGTTSASTRLKVVGKEFLLRFSNNSFVFFPFYLRLRDKDGKCKSSDIQLQNNKHVCSIHKTSEERLTLLYLFF